MRLIDADHLKRWIIAKWMEVDPNNQRPLKMAEILDQIDRESIYEQQLIKKGQWLRGIYNDDEKLKYLYCSECGHSVGPYDYSRYCSCCGAKMKESD